MNYLNCCCFLLAFSSFLVVVISASALSSQELKDPSPLTLDEDPSNDNNLMMSMSKKAAWKNLGAAWGKRAWADMQVKYNFNSKHFY